MNQPDTNLKRFLSSPGGKIFCVTAGSLVLGGAYAFWYGTTVENKKFALETVNITTGGAKIGDNGNGSPHHRQLRILHLSDIHFYGEDYEKAEFLRQITDDDYDIVVLTGDIFEKYSGIKFASTLLTRKPRIGAFAVLGNHDYYNYSMFNKTVGRVVRKLRTPDRKRDVTPLVSALNEVGYTVLQNQSVEVPEHQLSVVGIDWPSIAEDELQRLTASTPQSHFSLCLFHLPKNLDSISRAGIDLAVGGHTHGGQIRVPGYGPIITDSELPRREASGLIWRGDTAFHVSRGLGADPKSDIRLFCPPAVTLLNITHNTNRQLKRSVSG